jgi:hypothetical protein
MEGSSRIPRPLRPDSTPESQVRDARVRAWTFVFRCWQSKKGVEHDVTTSAPSNTESEITNNETGEN